MAEDILRLRLGAQPLHSLLGYLNFSEGKPDVHFQKLLHDAQAALAQEGSGAAWSELHGALRASLSAAQSAGLPAFRDITQAVGVLDQTFLQVMPAYRQHHRDLLFHLSDAELWQPFLIVRVCEAVLAQRGPWHETERIVKGALRQLNDFVGHRPVPVLENRERGEVYPHERVRPIPLYLRGVGVAHGRYWDIVSRAVDILRETEPRLLADAYFDLELLDEIALDPRGYDFSHPVDKRPNYCFGEWDPHHLDGQGRYRRFIVRGVTLEGLWQRTDQTEGAARDERIFEAAAVLAGTMLMAATVSGAGPESHDSTVSLTTLVPRISKIREAFYQGLLQAAAGPHGERLREEARLTKQPFGGARQALNQHLARRRALHLQKRHLALLLAELGYPAAARRQLADVAAASVRILTETQILLTTAQLRLQRGELEEAAEALPQVEDLLRRGIRCAAVLDPWSILAFQGNFLRFQSAEDSIRDPRVHDLVHAMDGLFNLHARVMSEGAAAGTFKPSADLAKQMRRLAQWWDRFATTTVSDVPHVSGKEATESAELVARALGKWRERGAAGTDLSFWRAQLDKFHSPKSFALVVDALLRQEDLKAALALLMTWLSQAGEVALEEGDYSFHQLALRWMLGVCAQAGIGNERAGAEAEPVTLAHPAPMVIKFFDYVEANAEELWNVPRLDLMGTGEDSDTPMPRPVEEEEEEESLFGAAYEGMTYKDSTDDDNEAEVLDFMPQKDFDLAREAERLEGRLRFLSTVFRLWNIATRILRVAQGEDRRAGHEALRGWLARSRKNIQGLLALLDAIHQHDIPRPSGSFESMVEYNNRRVAKERLLGMVIATCLDQTLAIGAMRGTLAEELPEETEETATPRWERHILQLERALVRGEAGRARDILRGFIPTFRGEPLLYTPLANGGNPRHILRSSLAQTILRSLAANLPRVGLIRDTIVILRLAHEMEQAQPLSGPRITEFDRLYQLGLQACGETLVDAALRDNRAPQDLVQAFEKLLEPFLGIWMDHSKTLRVAMLEVLTSERDWNRVVDFIKRFGKDLFTPRFLALGNIEAVLARGVAAFLDYLKSNDDPAAHVRLADELDQSITRSEAERFLFIILQAIRENYDSFKDYMSTTAQSDFGDNLYQYLDFLRLKASYDRNAWQFRPLSLLHEVLARKHGAAAALWRTQVQQICERNAQDHLKELARIEEKHGMRLPTIRDRVEERFVQPMALDRLCALIEPALEQASAALGSDEVIPLEIELRPYADKPTGVGLDVPAWILRLEGELNRARTARTALVTLAETLFQVPKLASSSRRCAELKDATSAKNKGPA
ncbi:MAG: hypothetical protein U0793_24160 [Gemmataceae bacterium]